MALTGVCDGTVDVSVNLGTPPKIGENFSSVENNVDIMVPL
jgi:hypothetical protein